MITQNNFNGGEIAPWLESRYDLDLYSKSLGEIRNFICTPYGSLRRRGGLEHVNSALGNSRLIPFQYGKGIGYVLEFGAGKMRVHRNGARVADVEESIPWSDSEIMELQYVQINAVLFVTHRDHPPQQVRFTSETVWSVSDMNFDFPAFKGVTGSGQVKAVADSSSPLTEVRTLNGTESSGGELSTGSIDILGSWEVVVNSISLDTSPAGYLRLEERVSGGSWETVQDFTTTGTYNGTQGEVELRLTLSRGTTNTTLTVSSDVEALGVGDVVALHSDTPLFTADHVGTEFLLEHFPTEKEVKKSLNSTGVSDWIVVQGKASLFTTGNWKGKIRVQEADENLNGVDLVVRSGVADRNLSFDIDVPEKTLLRIQFDKTGDGANNPYAYLSNDGSSIKGRVLVTGYTNSTEVAGVVTSGVYDESYTEFWREGSWGEASGYPAAVTWHEGRVWFGGSNAEPSMLWASVVDDFYNFEDDPEKDDAALSRLLGASGDLKWMMSNSQLHIGTSSEEWVGIPDSESGIITAGGFVVRRVSVNGSEAITPILSKASILHVRRSGREVLSIGYDAASATPDGYVPKDLSQLAPHVTEGGIVSMAYQEIRDGVIWVVTGNGKLCGMTYEPAQNVAGWHVHETNGTIQQVCVIHEGGTEDSVYVLTDRNGAKHIERMQAQYDLVEFGELGEMNFLDASVHYEGASTTSISGLDHLNGSQVAYYTNNGDAGIATVSGGAITVPSCTKCSAGLPFTSSFETLPIAGAPSKYKQVNRLNVRVKRSVTAQVACTSSGEHSWQDVTQDHREWPRVGSKPAAGQMGVIEDWNVLLDSSADRSAKVAVQITEPLPLNILSITTTGKVN